MIQEEHRAANLVLSKKDMSVVPMGNHAAVRISVEMESEKASKNATMEMQLVVKIVGLTLGINALKISSNIQFVHKRQYLSAETAFDKLAKSAITSTSLDA